MKASTLGAKEMLLLVLIAVTGAMALRDRLPASQVEIAQIGKLASVSASTMHEYEQAIESDPSMSIREARQLRERIASINDSRASALRFEDAHNDDNAWWRIHIRPFVPYALGALGAAIALQISRVRRKRHTIA